MSAKRNVTVPVGSAFTAPSVFPSVSLGQRDLRARRPSRPAGLSTSASRRAPRRGRRARAGPNRPPGRRRRRRRRTQRRGARRSSARPRPARTTPARTWRRSSASPRRRSTRRPRPRARSARPVGATTRPGRCPRRERLERRPQAAVGEDGRVDSAGELAELRERLRQLLARAVEELRGAAGSDSSFDSTRRSETDSATSRCCAPSWRFRSSTRRARSSARHETCARRAQVLCDPLALGDVEAGDEKKLALVDLRERRAGPRNREALARARHPGVVVLARRLARGNRLNEAAHIVSLGRVDELLPEHLAADL